VRGVCEYCVVGKQAHHQIKILIGEDAAGGVEHNLYIPNRENIRRRAAVALRFGEGGQAQKQSKNDERSLHVDSPRRSVQNDHITYVY
jgi:hypothetical protein